MWALGRQPLPPSILSDSIFMDDADSAETEYYTKFSN